MHQDCLQGWLAQRARTHCELCHHPFHFELQYAANRPDRLPVTAVFWYDSRDHQTGHLFVWPTTAPHSCINHFALD